MGKKSLIELADMLDKSGEHKLASKVDEMLEKLSSHDDYIHCISCGAWYSRFNHHHERKHCPKCGVSNLEFDVTEKIASVKKKAAFTKLPLDFETPESEMELKIEKLAQSIERRMMGSVNGLEEMILMLSNHLASSHGAHDVDQLATIAMRLLHEAGLRLPNNAELKRVIAEHVSNAEEAN